MADLTRKGALAAAALAAVLSATSAQAQDAPHRPAPHRAAALHPRPVHTAAARPLTIRRRPVAGAVDVVGGPGYYGDDYLVRQHGWNDPRLYYFGPFRTGGEVKYGDEAGNPITRGNAGLAGVAGYGPARGGFGGPHFDAVGGFHQGPGPDLRIDRDYASGSLSQPYYGDLDPHYPGVKEQVASLNQGVVPRRGEANPAEDRVSGRRLVAEGRSVSFEQAKADFAAPMRRQAPIEAAFQNGGLGTIGMQIGNGEF